MGETNAMHYFTMVFAALALVAGLSTVPGAPARAGVLDDCTKGSGNLRIAACTRFIRAGKLKGQSLGIIYYFRGTGYRNKRLFNRAIADYTKAIQLKPNFPQAYNNRGFSYRHKRLYGQAVADYTRAIQLKPDYAFAYYNRGIVYEGTGRKKLAIRDYRMGRRLSPNDPDFVTALRRMGVRP